MSKDFQTIKYLGGQANNAPEDKIADGKATLVANIDLSSEGSIMTRIGGNLLGDNNTTPGEATRLYLYKKNFGTDRKVIIKQVDDGNISRLDWYDYITNAWYTLYDNLYTGYIMAFAPANGDKGETINKLLMCNGKNTMLSWNGAIARYASATESLPGVVDGIDAAIYESGYGYKTGDILTLTDGTGIGATVKVETIGIQSYDGHRGGVGTFTPNTPGTGYAIGDIVELEERYSPSFGATIRVDSVVGGGATGGIATYTILNRGNYYGGSFGSTSPSQNITGSGSGFCWEIDSVVTGCVQTVSLLSTGSGYSVADGVATTGGSGTGCSVNITDIITAATLTKSGSTTWAQEGFELSGSNMKILINGYEFEYTGGTDSATLYGVTPDPSEVTLTAGDVIIQKVDDSYSGSDIGNVLMTTQAKLFLAGKDTDESTMFYSQTGDVLDFTAVSSGGLADAGFFTFMDGGGAITAFDSRGKNGIVVHKNDLIQQYLRVVNSDSTVSESVDTLGETDGCGAVNVKSLASIGTRSYFISKNEGLQSLSKISQDDHLQLDNLMDEIRSFTKDYDMSNAAIKYFPLKRVLLIACKSNSTKLHNDKVICFYIRKTQNGFTGEYSIDDIYANDFLVDNKSVYYASSLNENVYSLFDRNSNNNIPIQHAWISKALTYDEPAKEKQFNKLFLNGYMAKYNKIKISIIYGINGIDGVKSKVLSWDDSTIRVSSVGALGTAVLGLYPLGYSSIDDNIYIFNYPIHFDVKRSDRFKIKIETYYDANTTNESFWVVNNISVNPTLLGINQENVINSNR